MERQFTVPFTRLEDPPRPRWWERAFRRHEVSQRAAIALANRLADAREDPLPIGEVSRVLEHYGVKGHRVRDVLTAVWRHALTGFLRDDALSLLEVAYLGQLRRTLGISAKEAEEAERELIHPRYQKRVQEVLADGRFDPAERRALSHLAESLRLSESTQREIFAQPAAALLQRERERHLLDGRLSPTEQAEYAELTRQLGIEATVSEATRAELARAALFWRIENGDPPTIDVPLRLQRNERCYFQCAADWHEHRTRTRTVRYSGASVNVRIMKGVYYRIGSVQPHRVTTEELVLVDSGTLYITSKRVIFDGARKNATIRLTSLIGFEPYADGLTLEKGSGKNPHFFLKGDAELAAMILSRALADA